MTDVTLTDQQWAGVKRIVHWFKHETHEKQVARIFGYAGCGKSTILKFVLEELGLVELEHNARNNRVRAVAAS